MRSRSGQRRDGGAEHPGMPGAQVSAPFVDIDHLRDHGQDGALRNAYHLEPVADRDVVELGEGSCKRDLVVGGWPMSIRDPQHLDIAARVVTAKCVEREFPTAMLKLDRGRGIRASEGRCADERRRRGERLTRSRTLVIDLEACALPGRKRGLMWVAWLRQQREGPHPGSDGRRHPEKKHCS